MKSVFLTYPAAYGRTNWGEWAACIRQVLKIYAPDVQVNEMSVHGGPLAPSWQILNIPDPFLRVMIELLCTTLAHLHRYRYQKGNNKNKYVRQN